MILNEKKVADQFDEWVDSLDSDGWCTVQEHMKALKEVHNLGDVSAKILLSRLYLFVHENKEMV